MKRLLVIGSIICLIALSGCMQIDKPLIVGVSPESGHPPFVIEVRATAPGSGTYTFELYSKQYGDEPYDTITTTEGTITVTIHIDPRDWHCEVIWTDGVIVRGPVAIRVGLENDPPIIHRPQMTGAWDYRGEGNYISYLSVGQAYTFDFSYIKEDVLYPGYLPRVWGIEDPDGDFCAIVAVTCWAREKGKDNPDSIYTYPYNPDEFQVNDRPGFLVFPWWTGQPDSQGRPMTPALLPWPGNGGYTTPGCFRWDLCGGVAEQPWYMDITAEDQYGARTTTRLPYRLAPVGVNP
jgi:hypothetical protein